MVPVNRVAVRVYKLSDFADVCGSRWTIGMCGTVRLTKAWFALIVWCTSKWERSSRAIKLPFSPLTWQVVFLMIVAICPSTEIVQETTTTKYFYTTMTVYTENGIPVVTGVPVVTAARIEQPRPITIQQQWTIPPPTASTSSGGAHDIHSCCANVEKCCRKACLILAIATIMFVLILASGIALSNITEDVYICESKAPSTEDLASLPVCLTMRDTQNVLTNMYQRAQRPLCLAKPQNANDPPMWCYED